MEVCRIKNFLGANESIRDSCLARKLLSSFPKFQFSIVIVVNYENIITSIYKNTLFCIYNNNILTSICTVTGKVNHLMRWEINIFSGNLENEYIYIYSSRDSQSCDIITSVILITFSRLPENMLHFQQW
jgi:hypothetical protein